MANLLKNPSFEGEFHPWNNIPEAHVADGWTPFWVEQQPGDEPWKNRRPEYKRATLAIDPNRVRSGQSAQQYFSFWGTHIAGLLQQVSVRRGQHLCLRAYGHAWSSSEDRSDVSVDPGNVRMKIGIDPTGGVDPFGSTVVWSDERMVYDRYDERGFVVETTAQSSSATVFLFSAPEWPKKHTDVYWDDASLVVVEEAPGPTPQPEAEQIYLTLESATGRVGTPIRAQATSRRGLTNVRLEVSGPGGAVEARWLGLGPGGSGYVWGWEFTPGQEGDYTAVFSADGINSVRASTHVSGVQAPASPTPVVEAHGLPPSPTGEGVVASPGPARGLPRVQYARTYVLLPSSAGGEWIGALIRSGVLERYRWTVGYSADDAGIGDLDTRTVIVVNPDAWADPILPWFQTWYPGVAVRAIKASTPDELEAKLRAV
jgi:hypothetical protein